MTLEEFELGVIPKDFRSRKNAVKRYGFTGTPEIVVNEMLKGKSFTKKELEQYRYSSINNLMQAIKKLGYEIVRENKVVSKYNYTKYRLHSKHLSNG